MQLVHERASQRRHYRVSAPLTIAIEGVPFNAADWSLGGFRISGYQGRLEVGDGAACLLSIPFQGFQVSFEARATVRRRDPRDGTLACEFSDLNERATAILSHFIDEIVRGYMTPIEDTIQRIDVPVTPVSVNPDAPLPAKPPLRRLRPKALLMSAFYGLAGVVLFAYIASVLHANLFRLEVDTGVVSAPIEPLLAATDGRVTRLHAAPGQLVEAGTPLISLADPDLEEDIAFAEIRVKRARLAVDGLEEEAQLERGKLADYRAFALKQIDKAKSQLSSLDKRLATVRVQAERMQTLVAENWVPQASYEEVAGELARLVGEREQAAISLREREAVLSLVDSGRYFTGERFEGRLDEIEAAIAVATREVELAAEELMALQSRRDGQTIVAPARGRLIQVVKSPGGSTRRGEPIALFERDEDRVVDVFLTQEELLEVGLHDEAVIFFPSTGTRVEARVAAVDRTSGYIDEVESKYDWRGPQDRSAKVTLSFARLPPAQVRERFTPGLPAIAMFERTRLRDWWARLTSFRAYAGQIFEDQD